MYLGGLCEGHILALNVVELYHGLGPAADWIGEKEKAS